jgi:hypothetical protein
MNRTRTVALSLAATVAALAPALGQGAATAAPGTAYLQDPAGDEKAMRSVWSKGDEHKVEGQLRFHPGVRYETVTRPGPEGAPDFERQVADPKTLAWEPSYEFAWAVSDSTLVKKALTTKDGKHLIIVHAVLRDAKRAKAGEVREELSGQAPTGRRKAAGGERIACDTGEYTVDWSVTRSGYATVTGTLHWNSSCEQYRKAFSPEHGKQGQ